jgi:hypothetical protein
MLPVSYARKWNPHYNFLHSVLTELNVKPTVTIQCDADKVSIHTPGEERIFSSSVTICQTANLDTQRNTENVVCNRRIRSVITLSVRKEK